MQSRLPMRIARKPTAPARNGILAALACPFFLLASSALEARASLALDRVFGDHMVIQREQPVRLWGDADPGAMVTVLLAGQSGTASANATGHWQVQLDPLPAGGPHLLKISSGGETVRLEDILIGEVWLCAGQSNMRWELSKCESAGTAVPAADVPGLRLFDMVGAGHPGATVWDDETLERCTPEKFYVDPEWRVSSPEAAKDFSAVAYFFGRELHDRLGVPVGLIHNAISGACIEAFISREGLASNGHLAGAAASSDIWLDNPILPEWPRQRARKNLGAWLKNPRGTMPGHPFQPGFLYEAGIRPLARLGLRGAVWYQGESNATGADGHTPTDPERCRAGIETLIADWRRAFSQPELPFLYVQLPGMGRTWMEFREVQRRCLAIPNTAMAVTIDLGHPTDVHPRSKREVGRRLALLARADVYGGDPDGARSPGPSSWKSDDSAVVITFSDVAGGLETSDGEPARSFELMGDDGIWRPAVAALEGNTVIVRNARTAAPRAVRYAWAPLPDANLVGGTGLPVPPFREAAPSPGPARAARQRVAPDALAETSFENLEPGPFTTVKTGAGKWTAQEGHAAIDAAHSKSGKQCLHIVGGERRRVLLEPETGGVAVSELTFWAERWTRRDPFLFRIESLRNGRWREIYSGDDEILVGAFKTRVRIPVNGRVDRLRMTCTSPSGILIDDLRLGRLAPMEIVSLTTEQPVTPCLVGNARNPVALIRIETRGGQSPLHVTRVRINLRGTTDLDEIESVSVLDEKGAALGRPRRAAEELTFRGKLPLREGTNTLAISLKLSPKADIDHVVDAGCDEVRFSDHSQQVPEITDPEGALRLGVDLRDAGDDDAAVYRIPGIATTNRGTLIAVYDVRWRSGGDLPGDIDVGMSRSLDGGRNWEPMQIILDMGDDPAHRHDGVGDPAILVDRETGSIWVAATWSHGDRAWRGSGPGLTPDETGQLVLTRSDDDGRTWSRPFNITRQVKRPEWCYLLQGPGGGISMRDGTLVFAAQFQDTPENGRIPHSTILFSRDHGKTWQLGTGAKPNTTESQVVELEDGVLMLNMRDNSGGSRSVFTTRDLGQTWEEHSTSRSALVDPVCNAALVAAGGRTLLFANPAVPRAPRRRMTIKASTDLGVTWPETHQLLLDEGQSAGYPSMTMIDAKTVGILFEGSRAQLTFLRIKLADLIH